MPCFSIINTCKLGPFKCPKSVKNGPGSFGQKNTISLGSDAIPGLSLGSDRDNIDFAGLEVLRFTGERLC